MQLDNPDSRSSDPSGHLLPAGEKREPPARAKNRRNNTNYRATMTTIAERRPSSQLARAQAATGYLFVLPTAVLYLTFVIAPVIVTTILAFAYYDPMMGSHWVGFDNFTRFFTDRRSLQILWNTLRFTLFAVISFIAAPICARRPAGRR